jgi:hypothetical protein
VGCREAAEAWEAAFVDLAKGRLLRKAMSGGLRLSFSAERSVADELARVSAVLRFLLQQARTSWGVRQRFTS